MRVCLSVENDADLLRFHQQRHAQGAIFWRGNLHRNIVVEIRRCVVGVLHWLPTRRLLWLRLG